MHTFHITGHGHRLIHFYPCIESKHRPSIRHLSDESYCRPIHTTIRLPHPIKIWLEDAYKPQARKMHLVKIQSNKLHKIIPQKAMIIKIDMALTLQGPNYQSKPISLSLLSLNYNAWDDEAYRGSMYEPREGALKNSLYRPHGDFYQILSLRNTNSCEHFQADLCDPMSF